jgi:transcriptional regulator with XRE-family HTH domain
MGRLCMQGLTQEQFAELSGIGYKYYQLLEIGKRIDVRLSTVEKLAKAYGIQAHEWLGPTVQRCAVSSKAAGPQHGVNFENNRLSPSPAAPNTPCESRQLFWGTFG